MAGNRSVPGKLQPLVPEAMVVRDQRQAAIDRAAGGIERIFIRITPRSIGIIVARVADERETGRDLPTYATAQPHRVRTAAAVARVEVYPTHRTVEYQPGAASDGIGRIARGRARDNGRAVISRAEVILAVVRGQPHGDLVGGFDEQRDEAGQRP